MTREEAIKIAYEMGVHPYSFGWVIEALIKGSEIGANEQKKIDIDKACDWFENWAKDTKYYTIGESIEMLRKAMEE